MCGIAGIVTKGRVDARLVARMTEAVAHRGPDDEATWIDTEAGVGLGHRRLAIIDLTQAGRQPITSGDGRYVLTFNGEIYNHAELRDALDATGNGEWRGRSDSEVLVQAIAAWGLEPALRRSAGMFALGLWDRHSRTLSLARDRFGEKPLYYGRVGRDFLFASELKALRRHPAFAGQIDRQALALFASRGYVPAPRTIFAGLFKLQPGTILTVDGADGAQAVPRISRYWSYRAVVEDGLADPISGEGEAIDALEAALRTSIREQCVADVPVGAFLSGGIDSSTIVGLHAAFSPRPLRTYSIGFAEAAYDEAPFARAVARHFGTDHVERIVTVGEAQRIIPSLPAIYDEPFADPSQIPTFLMSGLARQQVKVALSGDGGDELFGGYRRYLTAADLWRRMRSVPAPIRHFAGTALEQIPSAAWDGLAAIGPGDGPHFAGARLRRTFHRLARTNSLEDLYRSFRDEWTGDGSPVIGGGGELEEERLDLGPAEAPDLVRMMYCDAVSYLPGDLLCKVDRASMAHGLEVRIPFLDHRVAGVAARIPVDLKFAGGDTKHVLKQLLYRHAPPHLFDRPKAGFTVPVGEWIKGPLRPWAEALLSREPIDREGYFQGPMIERRWREHLQGRRDASLSLWPILMFQAWSRESTPLADPVPSSLCYG